jgi:colanic acid biosynthesis glycosyl transferase WcaI
MRLVLCDYSGHPFQVELSRALAARGHEVLHLYFPQFETPKGNLTILPDDPRGFAVDHVTIRSRFDKRNFLKRRFLEAQVGAVMADRALHFLPEIVIGCNMPLDAQRKLRQACARHNIRFVFWLQDLYSHAIHHYLDARLGPLGRAIGRSYQRLEGKLLRSSDAVIAISEKFRARLEAWQVAPAKLHLIPNWAPLSEIYPVPKDNPWAQEHGLTRKRVALYTGTLGLKHDPELLLQLAKAGAGSDVHVVVVSQGAGVDWLARQKQALGLENLTLLPFQPMERYPEVLAAGDVLLAMIDAEAAGFSVPSKILSYLAAGKPIVASIAADNDAAAVIKAASAGVVVIPGAYADFCQEVLKLLADTSLRQSLGRNARDFAERRFAIESIATRFEDTFQTLLPAHSGAPAASPHRVEGATGNGLNDLSLEWQDRADV